MIKRALLGAKHDAADVLGFVMPAHDPYGLTQVDETEIFNLQKLAAGDTPDSVVTRVTFSVGDALVGYATHGGEVADVAAMATHRHDCVALFAQMVGPDTDVWVRGVHPGDVDDLAQIATVHRRLVVMAADLADTDAAACDASQVRAFQPGQDNQAVVTVLKRAYAGTPEGDWTLASFARRLAYPWFRSEDLLVFVNQDETVAGVHWMKQRDRFTGEVYNLAVDPSFAGSGVGTLLLHAGMQQLAGRGLTQMVLWVDAANAPAMRVYEKAGFAPHTVDVQVRLPAG